MLASAEIRKSYISLIGTVTGLQGYDTSMPIDLHTQDLQAYFTVTHVNTIDSASAKGSQVDNMAFREANPTVTMRIDIFVRNDFGFVSSANVEGYASQIENAIKRQLKVDGWAVYETELADIQPMNGLGTDRIMLTFRHKVQEKNAG